jgi:hypothetical protein
MEFTKLFLYIPGVIIFLVGSGQLRQRPGLFGGKSVVRASVVRCDHVVKKDRKERDTYNYYNVLVEFTNPQTGKRERKTAKSPTEFYPAQEVLVQNADTVEPRIIAGEEEGLFSPIAQMIGGALLILLAYWQNQNDEEKAMACLCAVLVGAGILLIVRYFAIKKRNLKELDAEIVEIYSRQLSRDTKILMSSKYTYYPVVRYQLDGKDNLRRCNINSSGEKSFKVGEHMKLYYDEERHTVTESHARPGMLIAGIILLGVGIAACAALFAALMH